MTDPVPIGSTTFRVRSYEVDARGAITLPSLCDLFQEAADRHASSFGAALDQIVATYGETWVLYRLAVRVHRAPRWRERVLVETWPCGRERLYAVREYRALSTDGELLAEGASAWLAMDLSTRRLSREPRTPLDWRSERERAWPEAFRARLPHIAENAAPAVDFAVRRGEIDVNGHVNHVHYLAWALEAAPDALWRTSAPVEASVEYAAEALAGEVVRARSEVQADGAVACALTHAADGRVLARALTRWAPQT
jgi:medium-chain acyl-[acyl-carrier-protein] hydrolase